MKTRMLFTISILVLAVLIISSCATTPKTKEEREGVKQEVFFQSVWSGDYAEVKRSIEEGADVNVKSNYGHTALMIASGEGHTEVAKLLIEEGVDVNAKVKEGVTALMFASGEGHTEVAQLLIKEGADVNAQNNEGGTALMIASQEGHTEVARLLIEEGVDVNAQTIDGFTALMIASRFGHPEFHKLLIDAGAGVNVRDNTGWTALLFASEHGHPDFAKMLIENGADVNARSISVIYKSSPFGVPGFAHPELLINSGYTVLMAASEMGHIDIVKLLIEEGVDVNAQDDAGWTALMYASGAGFKDRRDVNPKLASLLIDAGADVNVQDDKGHTAIWWAHRYGHTKVVELLIEAGAKEY